MVVDKYLELKNFECARRRLAEIWSCLVIDGNPVVATFTEDDASYLKFVPKRFLSPTFTSCSHA